MFRLWSSFVLLLSLTVPAFGQYAKLPAEIKCKPGRVLTLVAQQSSGDDFLWLSPDEGVSLIPGDALGGHKDKCIVQAPEEEGVYRVWLVAAKGGVIAKPVAECKLLVGRPKPPVPPVPPVPPAPPGPVANMRVLISYDRAKLETYPDAQKNVIYATGIRAYLNSKCPLGDDKQTHDWRIWDQNTDASAESAFWQKAQARPKAKTPWIAVYSGDTPVYEGELPADTSATLELLKKWGGP